MTFLNSKQGYFYEAVFFFWTQTQIYMPVTTRKSLLSYFISYITLALNLMDPISLF